MQDPYLYPDSNVLINRFDIRDSDKLQEVEKKLYVETFRLPLPAGHFDYAHLKAIHQHFFGDLYPWAGQERTIDIAKGDSYFGNHQFIEKALHKVFAQLAQENHLRSLPKENFILRLAYYFNEINAAHPFREGNGRTLRAFCRLLATQAGYRLDWKQVDKQSYLEASIEGFAGQGRAMEQLLSQICHPQLVKEQKKRNQ